MKDEVLIRMTCGRDSACVVSVRVMRNVESVDKVRDTSGSNS